MRLLNFFRRKKQEAQIQTIDYQNKSRVLLAMPIFINGDSLNLDKVVDNLQSFWGLK